MDKQYQDYSRFFKALSDPNRLMIVDMLSCGELCACVILEQFNITQPTLSHHMKSLCDSGLVKGRKEGKWIYYSLNDDSVQKIISFSQEVMTSNDDCICHEIENQEGCCNE